MDANKKILILTADAGFGHRSAALAIKTAIQEKFKDEFEIKLINPLDNKKAPFFLRDSQSEYDKWVRNVPELYKFGYEISDAAIPTSILEAILTVFLSLIISYSIFIRIDLVKVSKPSRRYNASAKVFFSSTLSSR